MALLGDTPHNVADGLTAVPLLVAFALARRPATKRHTYGLGRADDPAGQFVVFSGALGVAELVILLVLAAVLAALAFRLWR